MQYHEIGKTGMKVSSLSFGASSLGGVFHDLKEKEGIQAVFTAVEAGMNFIDVSPYYGHYKAETVLGKALKDLPRDCALIEPMSVGFHAVSRAQVIDNEYVMVIGCG